MDFSFAVLDFDKSGRKFLMDGQTLQNFLTEILDQK
jgi:hypothetical protein